MRYWLCSGLRSILIAVRTNGWENYLFVSRILFAFEKKKRNELLRADQHLGVMWSFKNSFLFKRTWKERLHTLQRIINPVFSVWTGLQYYCTTHTFLKKQFCLFLFFIKCFSIFLITQFCRFFTSRKKSFFNFFLEVLNLLVVKLFFWTLLNPLFFHKFSLTYSTYRKKIYTFCYSSLSFDLLFGFFNTFFPFPEKKNPKRSWPWGPKSSFNCVKIRFTFLSTRYSLRRLLIRSSINFRKIIF